MVSHPENGSDSPIGSDRDRGRDTGLRGKWESNQKWTDFFFFFLVQKFEF